MYKIEYDDWVKLKKDKQKLKKDIKNAKKIKVLLEKLVINPFSKILKIKKLQPKSDNKYRLKMDDYRIVYSIDFSKNIIIVHRIWLRKEIYKVIK